MIHLLEDALRVAYCLGLDIHSILRAIGGRLTFAEKRMLSQFWALVVRYKGRAEAQATSCLSCSIIRILWHEIQISLSPLVVSILDPLFL
jgi:hypothetical protein